MPSKLPRVSFVIKEDELKVVKKFQKDHNIKSLSKAVIALIEEGVAIAQQEMAEPTPEIKKAPPTRDEALLAYFGQLNEQGQTKVIDYARDLTESGNYSKNSADKLA